MNRLRFARFLISGIFVVAVGSGSVLASQPVGGEMSSPTSDWLVRTIDATRDLGYNVSVATDPVTGHIYISYYDGANGNLWMARTGAPVGNCGPGNAWECQFLDSDFLVGKYSSIAVGGTGPLASLYISYHDASNGSMRVVEGSVDRVTGAFSYSHYAVGLGDPTNGVFAGTSTSITLDDSGTPHIGYQVENGIEYIIYYATKTGPGVGNCGPSDSWECTPFDYGSHGDSIDIELDTDETPIIAFNREAGAGLDARLKVATKVASGGNCNASAEWRCDSIWRPGFDLGEYVSLAIGEDGTQHLAYRNDTTGKLEWARYVGSGGNCGNGALGDAWQCSSIESIGPGGLPSGIALDTDDQGHPLIAYQDTDLGYGDLKIARPLETLPWGPPGNCGPLSPTFFSTWLCEILDPGDQQNSNAHGGLSMAMTSQGETVVAYRTLFDPPSSPSYGYLKVAVDFAIVFRDGFESANTSAWSTTSP